MPLAQLKATNRQHLLMTGLDEYIHIITARKNKKHEIT